MSTRPAALPSAPKSSQALLLLTGATGGVVVGVMCGLAGRSAFIVGLWPLAAAAALGFMLVTVSHRLTIASSHVHLVVATVSVLTWCAAERGADGAMLWLQQRASVARDGLVLADHAVIHDSDDPGELVDAALLADTGARGVLGAMRISLRSGVPVVRAGHVQRIIRAPRWVVAFWVASRCGFVLWLILSALHSLREEPRCSICGQWMRRGSLGWISDAEVAQFDRHRSLAEGTFASEQSSSQVVEVLEYTCPNGHTTSPGHELRRAAGRRLGRGRAGIIQRWAAKSEPI